MKTKFNNPYIFNEDDPEFEHLVCLCGALVPIAHIKMIGQVEDDVATADDGDGNITPLYGFPVYLTDSNNDYPVTSNPQAIIESWDEREQAEEQRRNLAIQVDNYYKRLLGEG